jgi:hypothetical protein
MGLMGGMFYIPGCGAFLSLMEDAMIWASWVHSISLLATAAVYNFLKEPTWRMKWSRHDEFLYVWQTVIPLLISPSPKAIGFSSPQILLFTELYKTGRPKALSGARNYFPSAFVVPKIDSISKIGVLLCGLGVVLYPRLDYYRWYCTAGAQPR